MERKLFQEHLQENPEGYLHTDQIRERLITVFTRAYSCRCMQKGRSYYGIPTEPNRRLKATRHIKS